MIIGAVAIPLTSVFFERGAFDHSDTLGVSQIIFASLLGNVLFRMVGNIFQRSFYVLKDTSTQPIIDSVLVIVYLLSARFFVTRWGYVGLVWASVARSGLGVTILWILSLKKLPRENLRNNIAYILKYFVAALAAYIFARSILMLLTQIPAFFQLIIGGLMSVSLYILILYFLDRKILMSISELAGMHYVFGGFQRSRNWLFHKRP